MKGEKPLAALFASASTEPIVHVQLFCNKVPSVGLEEVVEGAQSIILLLQPRPPLSAGIIDH